MGKVVICDLTVRGVIGVNAWERESPREIVVNLEITTDLSRAGVSDKIEDCIDYQRVADKVTAHAAQVQRFTVEALAADIIQIVRNEAGVEQIRVRVEKPGAVASCRSVGVELEWP